MHDVQQAVERLGSALEDNGMPRMPSRVLAHLMAEDRGQCTAAELAAALRVSPAAVSGAVRFLTQHGLVVKERRPSGRGDVYRLVDGDVWATLIAARHAQFEHYLASLDAAVSLLDAGKPRPGQIRVDPSMHRLGPGVRRRTGQALVSHVSTSARTRT